MEAASVCFCVLAPAPSACAQAPSVRSCCARCACCALRAGTLQHIGDPTEVALRVFAEKVRHFLPFCFKPVSRSRFGLVQLLSLHELLAVCPENTHPAASASQAGARAPPPRPAQTLKPPPPHAGGPPQLAGHAVPAQPSQQPPRRRRRQRPRPRLQRRRRRRAWRRGRRGVCRQRTLAVAVWPRRAARVLARPQDDERAGGAGGGGGRGHHAAAAVGQGEGFSAGMGSAATRTAAGAVSVSALLSQQLSGESRPAPFSSLTADLRPAVVSCLRLSSNCGPEGAHTRVCALRLLRLCYRPQKRLPARAPLLCTRRARQRACCSAAPLRWPTTARAWCP